MNMPHMTTTMSTTCGLLRRWPCFSWQTRCSNGGTTSVTCRRWLAGTSPPPSPLPLPPLPRLSIYPPVARALAEGRPVVALESTILSHGLPYPDNVDLARSLAQQLRADGVEPATIALSAGGGATSATPSAATPVMGPCAHVGLSLDQITDLCQARAQDRVVKVSTRDMPIFWARHDGHSHNKFDDSGDSDVPSSPQSSQQYWGATTVAATLRLAHAAGIATFVTGGLGGVHRGGQDSLDISADLIELGRTPGIVVCAGVKSILDIPRTLEVLETHGVPVVAYQTDDFPAFFSPSHAGVRSPARLDTPAQIAAAYQNQQTLGTWGGTMATTGGGALLVAVPNHDPAGANVQVAIDTALREVGTANGDTSITGQAVTPYLLQRVAELTDGDSVRSNLALVHHNASVGAAIAKALLAASPAPPAPTTSAAPPSLQTRSGAMQTAYSSSESLSLSSSSSRSQVVVVGGILVDLVARPLPERRLIPHTSNPAHCLESDGGVGRNIAEVLGRRGVRPLLYSAVGRDARGMAVLDRLATECGVPTANETVRIVDQARTATYVAVLNEEGDLHVACADVEILQSIPTPPDDVLKACAMLVVDGNPPLDTIREVVQRARLFGVEVFFEPTSVPKAMEIAKHGDIVSCFTHMSPNTDELLAMTNFEDAPKSEKEVTLLQTEPRLETIRGLATLLIDRMDPNEAHVVVTMGAQGALLVSRFDDDEPTMQHFPPYEGVIVRNATGAGDSFTGATVHSLLQKNRMAAAVEAGMKAAVVSLECADRAIPTEIGD